MGPVVLLGWELGFRRRYTTGKDKRWPNYREQPNRHIRFRWVFSFHGREQGQRAGAEFSCEGFRPKLEEDGAAAVMLGALKVEVEARKVYLVSGGLPNHNNPRRGSVIAQSN